MTALWLFTQFTMHRMFHSTEDLDPAPRLWKRMGNIRIQNTLQIKQRNDSRTRDYQILLRRGGFTHHIHHWQIHTHNNNNTVNTRNTETTGTEYRINRNRIIGYGHSNYHNRWAFKNNKKMVEIRVNRMAINNGKWIFRVQSEGRSQRSFLYMICVSKFKMSETQIVA